MLLQCSARALGWLARGRIGLNPKHMWTSSSSKLGHLEYSVNGKCNFLEYIHIPFYVYHKKRLMKIFLDFLMISLFVVVQIRESIVYIALQAPFFQGM